MKNYANVTVSATRDNVRIRWKGIGSIVMCRDSHGMVYKYLSTFRTFSMALVEMYMFSDNRRPNRRVWK